MKATTAKEAIQALEAGNGPVEVTHSTAIEIGHVRAEFLDGWSKQQRRMMFGPGPYSPAQYDAFDLRILPDADEVGSREASVINAASKRLAELLATVDAAQEAFTRADERWAEAVRAKARVAGVDYLIDPRSQEIVVVPHASQTKVAKLLSAESDAWEAREEAGHALYKAKTRYSAYESNVENKLRGARFDDQG